MADDPFGQEPVLLRERARLLCGRVRRWTVARRRVLAGVSVIAWLGEGAILFDVFGAHDHLPAPVLLVVLAFVVVSAAVGVVQSLAKEAQEEDVLPGQGFSFADLSRPEIDPGGERFPIVRRPGGGV